MSASARVCTPLWAGCVLFMIIPSTCEPFQLCSLTCLVYDESSGVRHVRRMFHPGRGLGGPRARRTNMHFTSSSTGGLSSSQSSSYSPSNREAMDPIAGEQCTWSDLSVCQYNCNRVFLIDRDSIVSPLLWLLCYSWSHLT